MEPITRWLHHLVSSDALRAHHTSGSSKQQGQPEADTTDAASPADKLDGLKTCLPLKVSGLFLHKEEDSSTQGWLIGLSCPSTGSAVPQVPGSSPVRKTCSTGGSCAHRQQRKQMKHSSWCQGLSRASDRLSLRTILDTNSGVCTAELAWQVRADNQPARLAVKLSNRHPTRVHYDIQVAIRSSSHVLRLAGHPQGISTASLVLKPLQHSPGCSSGAAEAGSSCKPLTAGTDEACRPSPANTNSSRAMECGAASKQQPVRATTQRQLRHRYKRPITGMKPKQQQRPVLQAASSGSQPGSHPNCPLSGHSASGSSSHTVGNPGATADLAAVCSVGPESNRQHPWHPGQLPGGPFQYQQEQQAAASPMDATSVQWEIGWSWKLGGPVAAVTKQFEGANTSSGVHPLALQQVKAAYDAKARGLTLTAGGAGWNVVLMLPTPGKGLAGLLPRLDQPGCRPKVTLSLVPELTCF